MLFRERKTDCSNSPFLAFFPHLFSCCSYCVESVYGVCVLLIAGVCLLAETLVQTSLKLTLSSSLCLPNASVDYYREASTTMPGPQLTHLLSKPGSSPCVRHPLSPTRSHVTCGEASQAVIHLLLNILERPSGLAPQCEDA